MIARSVNAAADVITRAMENGRQTPAGWAMALDAACMLQTPEIAAELAAYRALELANLDGRVSASCPEPGHPTWLRKRDDVRGCPSCRVAELEQQLAAQDRTVDEDPIAYALTEKADRVTPQVRKLRSLLAGQRDAVATEAGERP
ncbi:hypothetical protein [Streptomyces chartreusis]|uniref:hypothetical protein n=1 Tax=Streptomyces chartreusis TaxID=1969 RepID=UPI003824D92D